MQTAQTTVQSQVIPMACDRAAESALGGRCRNRAGANGRCVSIASHRDRRAPRADSPDAVLVKFKLYGEALNRALEILPTVVRDEERIENEHALISLFAGRKFRGVRGRGKTRCPGDSGTPIFGQQGLRKPAAPTLSQELLASGYAVDNTHCWKRPDKDEGFLVVGYRRGAKEILFTQDQERFLSRAFGQASQVVHVWENIPQYTGQLKGEETVFKCLLLKKTERGVYLQSVRPLLEDTHWIPRSELAFFRREVVHTVNFVGSQGFLQSTAGRNVLTYNHNDGWGYVAS
ncbi:MAG: hypothetical protein Q8Q94_03835 [bacterium]|nr:hypothetical protein [bacterium]